MIIQCPACDSRYRINSDKLPAEGGNIKCPNCSEVFFVNRQPPEADVMRPVAPLAQMTSPPVSSPPADANAPRQEAWKVKNAVGLIYDFTDAGQLERWLSNRESSDGLQVSNDGGQSWGTVASFPELAGGGSAAPQRTMMGIGAVGAAAPAAPAMTAEQMREQAQARLKEARRARGVATTPAPQPTVSPGRSQPQRERPRQGSNYRRIKPPEEKPSANGLLVVLGVIIVPLVALVALEMAGVMSIRELVSGLFSPREQVYVDTPVVATEDTGVEVDTGSPDMVTDEMRSEEQMNAAAALLARGDRLAAITQMERAVYFDPDNYDIQCQLAPLYRSAGRNLQANQAQDRCNAGLAEDGLLPQEEGMDGMGTPPGEPSDPAMEPTDTEGASQGSLDQ